MLQARPAMLETRRRPAISTSALTYPVALLMAEIGDACDGPAHAMGDRIAHALRIGAAMPDLLTAELRAPRNGCYARHTIAADPAGRFTLLSIVWAPGQFSPPHAHDAWCAYAIAENTLTETLYEFDAQSGKAVAVGAPVERAPGYACFAPAGLEQIHRLGNATGVGAISLHAYGVEGSRVGTHVNRLMDVAERKR